MTILVPIMLFGWVPLSLIFFWLLPARKAILYTVIGGFLFLPMASYDLPGIPQYSKSTAITLGLLAGGVISGAFFQRPLLHWSYFDLPMVLLCFFCPIATSLSNGLGLYDGISGVVSMLLGWGVVYWVGRMFFASPKAMEELCKAIVIGGLIYIPFCIYELRMSPQLSKIFYGFFPHSFHQHIRFGGYRPIVFMQHGLMLALWMAQASIAALWLWRSKAIAYLLGIDMVLVTTSLFIITILCKSVNGWFFLILGILTWLLYYRNRTTWSPRLLLLLIPIYIFARTTMILPTDMVQNSAAFFINEKRLYSLSTRLTQEDLYGKKALERPLFGWGGYKRGVPVNPDTNKPMIRTIDALWTIYISMYGYAGLASLYSALLVGPWLILRDRKKRLLFLTKEQPYLNVHTTIISLVVIVFAVDTLMNGMITPFYILCSGALLGFHLSLTQQRIVD